MLICVLGLLTACVPVFPTRPMPAGFVEYRDGGFWLALVCGDGFTRIEVLQSAPGAGGGLEPVWQAERNVREVATEVQLLVNSMEGYEIMWLGEFEPASVQIVRYSNADGLGGGIELMLAELTEGRVAYYHGVVDRSEFERLPRADFGCS
mgnify:CR=1 FL=1